MSKELLDQDFQSKITESKGLVLVDFWAEWCGPCRTLGPVIEEVAQDFVGKLEVYKMDVDANPATPGKFQIRGIPTVILFRDGKPVEQIIGNHPKQRFVASIQRELTQR